MSKREPRVRGLPFTGNADRSGWDAFCGLGKEEEEESRLAMSKKKSDVSGDGILYEQENHISKGVVELVAFLVVPFVFILILSTYRSTSHTSLKVDLHTGVGTGVMFLYFSRLTCFFCYFGIFKIGFEEEQRQHSSEDHQAWTKVSYRI
ncbi:hypothetical protein MRB53_020585 [Persea americana]|uniref:Uncharacterized protein n=1 Tax=Persea americana TaxID=3435 RepID=A0ACC2L1Z6_PERAE|nr:hypothetical protein MRB53_020585 [Persea americana]